MIEISAPIQSFRFEEDFMENNMRCIPMIVRFKLDACGIKLKLSEWSKFKVDERSQLAEMPCTTRDDIATYRSYLQGLVLQYTKREATSLAIEQQPAWSILHEIPESVAEHIIMHHGSLSRYQWQRLTDLQRFALIKLSRPSHENKNFPKAMKEFGLTRVPIL